MGFFNELKEKIEEKVSDLTTLEHAMFSNEGEGGKLLVYRYQQFDGDNMNMVDEKLELSADQLEQFNKLFEASMISRQAITKFLIQTIL